MSKDEAERSFFQSVNPDQWPILSQQIDSIMMSNRKCEEDVEGNVEEKSCYTESDDSDDENTYTYTYKYKGEESDSDEEINISEGDDSDSASNDEMKNYEESDSDDYTLHINN